MPLPPSWSAVGHIYFLACSRQVQRFKFKTMAYGGNMLDCGIYVGYCSIE